MPSRLAEGHILVQARLRSAVEQATGRAWTALPAYNEEDIELWLSRAVPVVQAGQRQAVAAVDLYLARSLERQPLGLDADEVIAAARNGVTAEEVYRRPFVDVWGGLKAGNRWEDAVAAGLVRATSAAAMDMQLAMRTAVRDIGEADDGIKGYARVPDGGACDFCLLVAGQTYSTADLMPVHNRCGCGVEPITDGPNIRSAPTGASNDDGLTVAIEDHGELGPLLVNAADTFTAL